VEQCRAQLNWNREALEAWLEEAARNDESAMIIERYAGVDDTKIKAELHHAHTRHGTGSHFVTQRPSDPGIQRPEDPVHPVTLFYNELQMSTYSADKRLQWARGLSVFIAVWRLHASGK